VEGAAYASTPAAMRPPPQRGRTRRANEPEGDPTIGAFVERVVVPYLYGHAYFARHGSMPFGELAHGTPGLESDVRRLFHLPLGPDAGEFLRLASLKRRHTNKRPCPCQSGQRVARCHRAVVHQVRR
jgi:hypothetical protein